MTSPETALLKLDDLRKAVLKSNPTSDDIDDLGNWEKQIKKMALAKSWREHPVTKEVYGRIAHELVSISTRLSTEGDMPEEERRRIFEVKKAYLWLLSLHHTGKDDAILEQIEQDIEKATGEYGEYAGMSLPEFTK